MVRFALPTFVVLSLLTTARQARAETEIDSFREALEELARNESSECAEGEIEQARELIRLVEEAQRQGQTTTVQSVLTLLPLQLRLIREILEAARLEQRADELEAQLIERRRTRRVAREALDRVLERLLALSPLWGDGDDDDSP